MRPDSKSVWKLLKPHVRPRLWTFALIILCGGVSAMMQRTVLLLIEPTMEVLDPRLGKDAQESSSPLDELDPTGLNATFNEWRDAVLDFMVGSQAESPIQLAWRIALAILVLSLIIGVAQYAFRTLARWVALRMIVDLRMRLARHLMQLSMQYHGRRHFGDLLSRISNDVSTTLVILSDGIRDMVQHPMLALSALGFMLFIAPIPTVVLLVGLPVIAVPIAMLSRKVRKGSTRSLESLGSSVQTLSQMFQGVRTVKAFRAEERELENFHEANESYVHSTMRMARAVALTSAWSLFFGNAGMGILIVVLAYATAGNLFARGFGDITIFVLMVAGLFDSLKGTVRIWTNIQEGLGASVRLQALLDEPVEILDRPDARAVTGLGSGIRLENVSFAYTDGEGKAIDGLDLELRAGETLALVGPSGAGKSTVMDLVARFIDTSEGRVTVDGVDLRDVELSSWTDQYAMVGQTPFLFHTTIEENIRYGRPGASRAEIEAAARAAGIHDFIETLPKGYATDVADAGSRLSGGQRQRLTIARAFLKEAPLLLLDEATSALDTESEAVVQEALRRLMTDRTVLVIAHRLSTIRNADRIAVLDGGRLIELGTHDELIAKGGLYARLSKAQDLSSETPRDPAGTLSR